MQLNANVPGDLVYIIQALVLFSIAAEFLPAIQRALPKGFYLGRRPSLVPTGTGATVTDLPANESAPVHNGAEPVEMQQADAVEGEAAQSLPTGESSSSRIEED